MVNTFRLLLFSSGLIGAGFILGKILQNRFIVYQKALVSFILNFLVPLFIITSLWGNKFVSAYGIVMLAALLVISGGTFFAFVHSRMFKKKFGEVCLPIIFMNSAYLAIPINTYLFGEMGTTLAIMYGVVVTAIHFTFGIWWVNREKDIQKFLEFPAIYAVGIGLLLNIFSQVPASLKTLVATANKFILILMLVFVGYRISFFSFRHNFLAVLVGLIFRIFGGFFLALAVIKLLSLKGIVSGVVLITSSMPSAINTYLLSEHFEQGADFAAAMILAGISFSFIFWLKLFPLATALAGF